MYSVRETIRPGRGQVVGSLLMLSFFDYETQRSRIQDTLNNSLDNVFTHGKFILGPEVAALESSLIRYTDAKHCITCANGTDALHIALLAVGVGPGDEVIVPAFTYVAPAEVVRLIGAIPVYVDVSVDDYTVLTEIIEKKITRRTKAIIAVSLYGQPADFKKLAEIENKYGITIIEDAAQSFGAEQLFKKSCNLSTIACTSFFPSKPLGCYGDGGAVFTSDHLLSERIRLMARHGQRHRYNHIEIGMNSRLDTIQAAILMAKLDILDTEINLRQKNAEYLNELIEANNDGEFEFSMPLNGNKSAWAQYTLKCQNRKNIIERLTKEDIPYSVHYPKPIFQQTAYKEITTDCSNSVTLSEVVLSLPINAYTKRNEISYLCEVLFQKQK